METYRRLKDDLNECLNWVPDHIKRARYPLAHNARLHTIRRPLPRATPDTTTQRTLAIPENPSPSRWQPPFRLGSVHPIQHTDIAELNDRGRHVRLPGFLVRPTRALTMIRLEGVYFAWNERFSVGQPILSYVSPNDGHQQTNCEPFSMRRRVWNG